MHLRELSPFVRLRSRREGGFALMTVLFVLALVSVIVIAVLGLSFTTAVYATDQERRDRQTRAADSALEAAVNQIARDGTGNLGSPVRLDFDGDINAVAARNCTAERPGEPQFFGDPAVRVFVECEALPAPSGALAGTANSSTVRVVGNAPGGRYATTWNNDAAYPWDDAIGAEYNGAVQSALDAATPTFLHTGPQPLSVAANLDVRRAAAVMNTKPVPLVESVVPQLALNVAGQYRQGDPGLLSTFATPDPASPSYDTTDPSNSCGILQSLARTVAWSRPRTSMVVGGNFACNNATVRNFLTPDAPGVAITAPVIWSPRRVLSSAQTVPSSCFAGASRTFEPGSYNRVETQKLNNLLDGSCPGKTFLFNPGDYWFDVNDSTSPADRRSALIIDDPTARVVFGTATAAGAATSFPRACDTTAPGVTIALSGRTTIHHESGRVAICGKNGPNSTAIWQSPNGNLGWVATPVSVSSSDFSNPNAVLSLDGASATATIPCISATFQGCSGFRRISINNLGEEVVGAEPGSSPMDSAVVLIRSTNLTSTNEADTGSRTELRVRDRNGVELCSVVYRNLPSVGVTVAYELLDASRGSCGARLTDRSQLVGASVEVAFFMEPDCGLLGLGLLCFTSGPSISVDYINVRIPWKPSPAGTPTANRFNNPFGVLTPFDGQSASLREDCYLRFGLPPWVCPGSSDGSVTLPNFSDLNSPELSSSAASGLTLTSAGVVVSGDSDRANSSGAQLQVSLTGGGIASGGCIAYFPGLTDRGEARYLDLRDTSVFGNCAQRLTSASQLVGASLEVTALLRKDPLCIPVFCSSWGFEMDHISMMTTSEVPNGAGGFDASQAYAGPPSPFRVTSHASLSSGDDAVFFVGGQVSLPRVDLDVAWTGPYAMGISDDPAPGALSVQPIFAGRGGQALVVSSLSSFSPLASTDPVAANNVGVVCCAPAKAIERRVRLTARLGDATGPVLGRAQVYFRDVSVNPFDAGVWRPGQRTTIEDWELCTAPSSDVPADCNR